jgi:hypothetical protein
MTQTPNLWERLESDTDKSFEAFCVYRDMGVKRSLDKVSQELSKSIPVFKKWSITHNWQERVAAYDTHQATLRKERKERKQIEIEDNVLSDYDFLRACIQKRIDSYTALNFRAEPFELQDLLSMMKQADDYARRAVGLPDKVNSPQRTEIANAPGESLRMQQTNVNIAAESAHDASNILKQLAELGAIPSEPSAADNHAETE